MAEQGHKISPPTIIAESQLESVDNEEQLAVASTTTARPHTSQSQTKESINSLAESFQTKHSIMPEAPAVPEPPGTPLHEIPVSAAEETTTTSPETAATTSIAPISSPKDAESIKPVAAQETGVLDAPDPDEDDLDDLDDLDDVLDEFQTKINVNAATADAGPGRTADLPSGTASKAVENDTPLADDEFAQELQKGMADLLGELESSPEMQKQFEDMIRELGKGQARSEDAHTTGLSVPAGLTGLGGAERATPSSASASEAGKGEASFQDTIRKTMERMQESGEAAGAAAATSANKEDDFMAALLKEMEAGGSDEDFSKMLLGMMEQLTNKEILYEPMKELNSKFPDWMKKNGDKTSADDMRRYREQQRLVGEIVAKFEEPGYSDENVPSREYILERMQKMQGEGSPPADLVGDMDVATEALGELDAGCPTQ